jgi:hypothetical protein
MLRGLARLSRAASCRPESELHLQIDRYSDFGSHCFPSYVRPWLACFSVARTAAHAGRCVGRDSRLANCAAGRRKTTSTLLRAFTPSPGSTGETPTIIDGISCACCSSCRHRQLWRCGVWRQPVDYCRCHGVVGSSVWDDGGDGRLRCHMRVVGGSITHPAATISTGRTGAAPPHPHPAP